MRLATTNNLWFFQSYTGDASLVAIVFPKGYVRFPHVFPPSTLFFWQTYMALSLEIIEVRSSYLGSGTAESGIQPSPITILHSA